MSPVCIPTDPDFASTAEKVTWSALKASLKPKDVLIANLRLSDSQGDHEADLVVGLAGAGILVIEVKGGSVSHDGQSWHQESAGFSKVIDPVNQVRRTKYALLSYLDRDPRWARRNVRLGHAVALPYTVVSAAFGLPGCSRSMVLDRSDVAGDPVSRLRQLLVEQDNQRAPTDAADLKALVEVLGGRGLPQRDVVALLAERNDEVNLRTELETVILSALRLIHRVSVVGGAGTGKTYLALAQTRRLTRAGQRVALTCYSRGLASYLKRVTAAWPRNVRPAYVGTFHGLGELWGAPSGSDDDSDFWERRLPEQMVALAGELPPGMRFDSVVVDEAQDFADSWWPALLASLLDPEEGGVYVFSDEGQRVFARQSRPPVALVPILLDDNLRNTVRIAETFAPLVGVRMRYRGDIGVPVRFVPCDPDAALDVADDEVERLLDEGWPLSAVALLTTGRRHPEQVARQEHGQDAYWDTLYDDEQVFYGHVLGFKGIERPAVVLAVNGFGHDGRAREKLYVGLSRARDLLVVCGDPAQLADVGAEAVLRRMRR
jgi:Nuclease-related domain/UvrD-like helicase C-terminal domain/AAA domain